MAQIALAVLYALFVWWFATGLVLLLVIRRDARRIVLAVALALVPASLAILASSAATVSITNVYVAFSATIALWATQEVAFLTGAITGPRPRPCPDEARGFDRFCYALSAIFYHEVALVLAGACVVGVTWGGANQIGTMTFLVLWVMRLSAKFNLFLGVPVLNDSLLPERIAFVRSYFRRGPASLLLYLCLALAVPFTWMMVASALASPVKSAREVGDMLVATLLGLAVVEHAFMLLPLPIERLWHWASRAPRTDRTSRAAADAALERTVPLR